MATPWFCKIGDEELGPLSGSTLKELAHEGKITPETPIRRGDSTRWVKAAQLQGLFGDSGSSVKPGAAASSSNLKLKRAQSLDGPPKPPLPPPVAAPPPSMEAASMPPVAVHAAPPSAPPPQAAIPVGVPVGTPVGPAGVPLGQGIPVGQAVPSHSHGTGHEGQAEHEDPYAARKRKKQQQQLIMVAAMVLVAVGLTVAGAAYALWGGSSGEVADNAGNDEGEIVVPPLGENDPAAPLEAPTGVAGENQPNEPDASEQAVQQLLAEVEADDWREISPLRTIKLPGKYELKVRSAWISDDPRGATALDPALALRGGSAPSPEPAAEQAAPADAEAPPEENAQNALANLLETTGASLPADDDAEPEGANQPPTPGRFIVVEVELTNSGSEPLTYLSWNPAGGEEAAASLIADESRELSAIPIRQAPGPARSAKQVLQPGEELVDFLMFAAPRRPASSLKLVLPKQALGREGAYGFEVTPAVLAAKHAQQLAEAEKAKGAGQAAAVAPAGNPATAQAGNNTAPAQVGDAAAAAEAKPLSEAERLRLETEDFIRRAGGAAKDPAAPEAPGQAKER